MGDFEVEIQYWGYSQVVRVAAETKFLALAKAKEQHPGQECRFPKEAGDDKKRA